MFDRLLSWLRRRGAPRRAAPQSDPERIVRKYRNFQSLLGLNNECLELMAGLQEDLQYVPPRRDVVGDRITAIYEKVAGVVAAIEGLAARPYAILREAVSTQRSEVERYIAAQQELAAPRLAASLSEIGLEAVAEVGGKAAWLGEVKNRLGLAVPDGYVMTTEAYRQFFGIPQWQAIRDSTHDADVNDLTALETVAAGLQSMVLTSAMPRAIEVALTERARLLDREGRGLAVRSSAIGEGGARTYAGQYLTLLNVPADQVVEAYKQVVAGRFSGRALAYRLETGMLEVDNPLAVLVLPILRATAAGIIYTRDPSNPKSKELWVTATRGLGLDIAGGGTPTDLFVVSRKRPHEVLDRQIVRKEQQLTVREGGGLERKAIDPAEEQLPSLAEDHVRTLAAWGVRVEEHFHCPQDIEWALDEHGQLWILQSRPLALTGSLRHKPRARAKGEPLISGGRTVFPGCVSGKAFLAGDARALRETPEGSILVLRKASPEIVQVFPRISGLVAEWGNLTGHAAALLREFKVPSVFLMHGVFDRIKPGDAVSLDAVQAKIYPGIIWNVRHIPITEERRYLERRNDPISTRLLNLNLVDPMAANFTPRGCKSTHDVLRYCHETAVQAMFDVNDLEVEFGARHCRQLKTSLPLHILVLDLGGGLALADPARMEVTPEEIACRPFQGLWKGFSHPMVTWTREMPARLSDLASVFGESLYAPYSPTRALGEKSFLLVAGEYMNLNSRLAYHFSLIDACVSDQPASNYISFRFCGGGAAHPRRNLRAWFIEECLAHYGFLADRRGDLVNAWFKKGPAAVTLDKLDILGRLMACAGQLDMYMANRAVMKWYIEQFIEGNYMFQYPTAGAAETTGAKAR